VARGI